MAKILDTEGIIFKIKRFAVHDGPGIRTTVFLKGCPLSCIWCHSPEGITPQISVWYNCNFCITCSKCIRSCPEGALLLINETNPIITIDRTLCKVSGECVKVCPTNALQLTGSITTASEIIKEIENDILYYQMSGGGVTLTGGEPLMQPEFSAEILQQCRKRKIHTAIETSLFSDRKSLTQVMDLIDLFIVDIKLFDSVQHLHYTGRTNEIIKDNFQYISKAGKAIIVRIPMIKNITDSDKNIKSITDFVHSTDRNIRIEKISYNPLTENNYKKLDIPFLLK
ncbi:MAG TPA: glycyl-radical enzyme activating protein [Bacteroidales bacterium]|nr:glycyl-radical enzyme activating protein [Bacteroidales bacterium]